MTEKVEFQLTGQISGGDSGSSTVRLAGQGSLIVTDSAWSDTGSPPDALVLNETGILDAGEYTFELRSIASGVGEPLSGGTHGDAAYDAVLSFTPLTINYGTTPQPTPPAPARRCRWRDRRASP